LRAPRHESLMQLHKQSDQEPFDESRRYEVLLEMTDLRVRHHSLPELFQDIADRLRSVAVCKRCWT
jgi:hypothetical protein